MFYSFDLERVVSTLLGHSKTTIVACSRQTECALYSACATSLGRPAHRPCSYYKATRVYYVIQLKILTCVRAGKEQKKIDIDIPKFTTFLHHIYINAARKIYTNIYLYENDIPPLQRQKYNREIEMIVQEAIINTIRQNMPIEELLKAYIEEHIEEDVEEEISEKTYDVEEAKDKDKEEPTENWKQLDTDSLLGKEESDKIIGNVSSESESDNLVVSNNISNELLDNSIDNSKAITFNEVSMDNNLEASTLNDIPETIKIYDDDVKFNIESLDGEDNLDDGISLDIEELA